MAQIRIQNVRKDFGTFNAVRSSTFTVEDGEFFTLLGPSGCGKTTTLRMIAGLELPTSGEIFIDGADILKLSIRDLEAFRREKTGMVFQRFGLFPHRTVLQNVAYGLEVRGEPRCTSAHTSRPITTAGRRARCADLSALGEAGETSFSAASHVQVAMV